MLTGLMVVFCLQLDARMLKYPTLQYQGNKTVTPRDKGSWHEVEFFKPAMIESFAIVSFAEQRSVGGYLEVQFLMKLWVLLGFLPYAERR